jgi:hypothetical protein
MQLLVALLVSMVTAMRVYRPWTSKHWCDSVIEPQWPLAYSKYQNQLLEFKGRVNSNIQDMRHKCSIAGVQSKCHICEPIQCGRYEIESEVNITQEVGWRGQVNVDNKAVDAAVWTKSHIGLTSESNFAETCEYQLQGIQWKDLAKNIPTVSDTPWAINGAHRNDFGNGSHICVMMSGGYCISPYSKNYSECTVRCWGKGQKGEIKVKDHKGKLDATQLPRNVPHKRHGLEEWPKAGDYGATDSWERERDAYHSQGYVGTMAGTGVAGFQNGNSAVAQFNGPQGVAVDDERNVYVADTGNNCIRKVTPAGMVSTYAGVCGKEGYMDGTVDTATFSAPMGVSVYYDWRNSFRYKGCFNDMTNDRDLPAVQLSDKYMTPTMCWHHCWEYKYFGVQRGTECWCGNSYGKHGETDLHKCDTQCGSYAGTPEDPPWGSQAWGPEAPPAADNYLPPGQDSFHGGGTNQWLRTDRGKCGGHTINSVYENRKGAKELQIFVADTGNHRVRLIRNGTVECFAGRCGNGQFSNAKTKHVATPQPGYADGTGDIARFHTPMGVAVDSNGTVFVADTYNYLIRMINYEGVVHTLAGSTTIAELTPEGLPQPGCPAPCLKGVPGSRDGDLTYAQFAFPADVTVGLDNTVVVTDNQKIRSVTYSRYAMLNQTGEPHHNIWMPYGGQHAPYDPVSQAAYGGSSTFGDNGKNGSSKYGMNSNNYPESQRPRPPWMFDSFNAGGHVAAVDWSTGRFASSNARNKQTHNGAHWIDETDADGRHSTLDDRHSPFAAQVGAGYGHVGIGDGSSTIQGVTSMDRVVTLAGESNPGRRDGKGQESSFNKPEGVAMDVEGKIYVSGTVSCRIRRISSAEQTAVNIGCGTIATEIIRPTGCSSYNPPVDELDFTATPGYGNHYMRYSERTKKGKVHDFDLYGRRIYNCQGTPPVDTLEKGELVDDMHDRRIYEESMFPENYDLVTSTEHGHGGEAIMEMKEDTMDGTTIKVHCPGGCQAQLPSDTASPADVWGSGVYSDFSSVCLAAIHAGAIDGTMGGLVTLTLQRGKLSRQAGVQPGSTNNSVHTRDMPPSKTTPVYHSRFSEPEVELPRVFTVAEYPLATVEVQTVAGHPTTIMENNPHACGFADATPAQEARFNKPTGVAMFVNTTLKPDEFLYIADTNNHRIRQMTAVCAKICENGGQCTLADTCTCSPGWEGDDCTLPICTPGLCGERELCVGPNECACIPGYNGTCSLDEPICVQDCHHGGRCSAPDTCECLPGWFDSNCTTPVCTQTCAHGGNCTAPSICTCPSEWTGVDCRVPVCEQAEWNGHDGKLLMQLPGVNTPEFTERRGVHPIYRCRNGGYCTAPNTCTCPPQWSGHDCGLPVCTQGYMVPNKKKDLPYNPNGHLGYNGQPFFTWHQPKNLPRHLGNITARPDTWIQYAPCDIKKWVNATNTFDFKQRQRLVKQLNMPFRRDADGTHLRNVNGWNQTPPVCMMMEVAEDALTQYQYLDEFNRTTPYAIYTPKTPYGPHALGHPWQAWTSPTKGYSSPWEHIRDRQVALVELVEVAQGPYVCANGGNCSAPDVCTCAPGWIGFDCRTPVCEQGFYEPQQLEFATRDDFSTRGVSGARAHERQPDSNPAYLMEDQNITATDVVRSMRVYGDIRYLAHQDEDRIHWGDISATRSDIANDQLGIHQKWTGQSGLHELLDRLDLRRYRAQLEPGDVSSQTYQGGYSCSIRSVTHWERGEMLGPVRREGTCFPTNTSCDQNRKLFVHDNYYSRYMDREMMPDGLYYTHWEGMQWPVTYKKTEPLLDNTDEGHRRDGVWYEAGKQWQKGVCLMEFDRTCKSAPWKEKDMITGMDHILVTDTDASYRARASYAYDKVRGTHTESGGRWYEEGGECVDEVIRGCYNNGTCVAPNTCRCSPGWTGFDCSVPICQQECLHNGNCTTPNTCTCEKGWTGHACEVPMCAQDCNNGGVCIAPDVCHCRTWPSKFVDNSYHGGIPLFKHPDTADSAETGWTGYDCNTPICVQHERFILNVMEGTNNENGQGWQVLYGRSKADVGFTDHSPIEDPSPYPDRSPPPHKVMIGEYKILPDYENYLVEKKDFYFGALEYQQIEPIPGVCYDMGKVPDSDPPQYSTAWDTELQRYFPYLECPADRRAAGTCDMYFQDNSCPRQPWSSGICLEKPRCYDEYGNSWFQMGPRQRTDLIPNSGGVSPYQALVENSGKSFQSGCALVIPYPRYNSISEDSNVSQILRLRDYIDAENVNRTNNLYLCNKKIWTEGDYIDDGNSGMLTHQWHKLGPNPYPKLQELDFPHNGQTVTPTADLTTWERRTTGRHVRRNDGWNSTPGEGIYACYNEGSCIYPDRCTCPDGWTGFDCQTPLCRHKQTDPWLGKNLISSCLNGGLCVNKDNCTCIQTRSVLHLTYPDVTQEDSSASPGSRRVPLVNVPEYVVVDTDLATRESCEGSGGSWDLLNQECNVWRQEPAFLEVPIGYTGWTGSDCSIAICAQGFFDPDCTGIAPAGQGCYRCNNGGNCTAPDHCTCAEGWTGYDCMTPVCTQVASSKTRVELFTVDEDRVHEYEMDPCGEKGGRWGMETYKGLTMGSGNCTMPNVCTCLCKDYYHPDKCRKYGAHCKKAWKDPLGRSLPVGFIFGGTSRAFAKYESDVIVSAFDESSRNCPDGYEGNVDSNLRFTSCHLKIYVPEWWERDSIILIAVSSVLLFLGISGYLVLRRKLKQRYLLAKAERRRSRRSSDDSDGGGAFGHK